MAGSTFLLDYASIKNGSYLKLMKAYYAEDANDTVKSLVNSDATERQIPRPWPGCRLRPMR